MRDLGRLFRGRSAFEFSLPEVAFFLFLIKSISFPIRVEGFKQLGVLTDKSSQPAVKTGFGMEKSKLTQSFRKPNGPALSLSENL